MIPPIPGGWFSATLQSKEAVTELFREVSTKVAESPGGYTRIIKLGQRLGDNAEMAIIELVDFNLTCWVKKKAARPRLPAGEGRGGQLRKADEETSSYRLKRRKRSKDQRQESS